jgi:hypothetical protein
VPLFVRVGLGRRDGYLDPQGYEGSDGRVVHEWDFGAAEFLASDCTDEPWDGGPQPPDPPRPPKPPGGGGNCGGDP